MNSKKFLITGFSGFVVKDKIKFIYADMTDVVSLVNAMKVSDADEVYNLAAPMSVYLRNAVRASGIKRRGLLLGNLLH